MAPYRDTVTAFGAVRGHRIGALGGHRFKWGYPCKWILRKYGHVVALENHAKRLNIHMLPTWQLSVLYCCLFLSILARQKDVPVWRRIRTGWRRIRTMRRRTGYAKWRPSRTRANMFSLKAGLHETLIAFWLSDITKLCLRDGELCESTPIPIKTCFNIFCEMTIWTSKMQ